MSRQRIEPTLIRALVALVATAGVGCSDTDLAGGPGVADGPSQWTMLGSDYASTYHNRAETKIRRENVGELKIHWSFKPAGQPNGTPAVVDGVVYATSSGGTYAFDADTGTVLWFNRDLPATSSPTYFDGMLYTHSTRGIVSAVDPASGTVRWSAPSDDNPFTSGFSSPVATDRYVIVGVASVEEGATRDNATFHGGVIAFDRATGERVWRYYTAVDPYTGASVWSTVTIDLDARRVFGTTGNNYTGDPGPNSDSIFALDLDTGKPVWTTQLSEGDVFTILNQQSPDSDFGANPTLFEAEVNGVRRKMLAAGQKSGVVWGLDRETGEVIWETPLTSASALIGGILNTGAYDGEHLIVAANEFHNRDQGQLVALDPATGAVTWQRTLSNWVWAPITTTGDVAFVATWTTMRAYDTETGDELFTFDTPGTITSGAAIADGRIYFGSGMAYIVGEPERTFYALSLPGDEGPGPEPTATPAPSDTTFTSIYEDIFVAEGCASGSCHGANAGNLSMATRDIAYEQLVGVAAMGEACGPQGTLRVDPGNPDGSLLLQKISGTTTCGDTMPIAGMLEPAQIDRVRTWIADGAADD